MVLRSNNPWENTTISGLVSVGTHRLHISTSGPARKPGQPVIILFTGGGTPTVAYVRLQRLLSQHWRVYFYDRSGYDRSERGPDKCLTAQQAAVELSSLLEHIAVPPPYVLIGNSYGAILARAFLEMMTADAVTGLMLAEPGTELMCHLYPHIPSEALQEVGAGIDVAELTHFREESKLTDEEYKLVVEATLRSEPAAAAEDNHGSAYALAQCHQFERAAMEPWPVVVIRCDLPKYFRLLFHAGVEKGQGSLEQRCNAMAFIHSLETFDDEPRVSQLRLSSCHRYTHFPMYGHDDLLRRPGAYLDEMRWIMDRQQ